MLFGTDQAHAEACFEQAVHTALPRLDHRGVEAAESTRRQHDVIVNDRPAGEREHPPHLDHRCAVLEAQSLCRATRCHARSAADLGVDARSPLLAVERVAYTYDDRPMEWRLGHYDTESHYYATTLD
ncbi:MAG: UTRA domain-containing protein, partial [Betaproteobacteria bacterium]|nr:UTRA domain-containing protein [Betaproteobacteria bacterium]